MSKLPPGQVPPSQNGDIAPYLSQGWTFETVAGLYDTYRPDYAPGVFSYLVETIDLPQDARILEIGAGAGQASGPFAVAGYDLTAIEPGPRLADYTRERLKGYPNVRVITDKFEGVELADASFNLVYSAMALHWVPEAIRFTKIHRILKPGGHLALLSHDIIADGHGDAYNRAEHEIGSRYGFSEPMADNEVYPQPEDLYDREEYPRINRELFDVIDRVVFTLAAQPQTAQERIGFMSTLSSVIAMPPEKRAAFLAEVQRLIETEFNNKLDHRYATVLTIARKKELPKAS